MTDEAALGYGLYALVTVLIYAYVGRRLGARPVAPGVRLPAAQFAAFWYSLAAIQAVVAFLSLLATVQIPSLVLVVTLFHLETLIACVVLWALVSYLIFLFTGRTYLASLSVLYAAVYLVLQYVITAAGPYRVTVTYGSVGLSVAGTEGISPILLGVLLALLLVPEIVGCLLYFTLFFRTPDRTLRFRIGIVSWALLLWFVGGFAITGAGLVPVLISRSIGLLAAAAILLAYFPPAGVQRRLGVTSVDARPIVTGRTLRSSSGDRDG